MSLPDILLSVLRRPMSGSELIQLFEGTFDHFWNTDLSQIYKALDGLRRDGCVDSDAVPSKRGPARRVYRLTRKGRARLAGWIRRAPQAAPAKYEHLAQLFSVTADRRPRKRAREMLLAMRDEAARSLEALEGIEAQFASMPGYPEAMPSFLFYPWLTLQHGVRRRRASLEWVDDCLAALDRRPDAAEAGSGADAMTALLEALREHMKDAEEPAATRGKRTVGGKPARSNTTKKR